MLMAAASAIAGFACGADELVPDALDKELHQKVAAAVQAASTGPPQTPQ
jgi:malic enzyme